VQDGVGGQFVSVEDHVVCGRAVSQVARDLAAELAELIGPAREGLLVGRAGLAACWACPVVFPVARMAGSGIQATAMQAQAGSVCDGQP
jgi:hypothetical protein